MKKFVFIAALIAGCFSFKADYAQVHLSVGINIGSQPDWGPVGYDHVDYYYLPDIDVYYDVPAHEYIYLDGNVWVRRAYLPPRYRDYDIYHGYKVVVNERHPWRHNAAIRAKYRDYRGRHDQVIIRDSHDPHYRDHWHDNGRHRGRDGHEHGRGDEHGHGHGHDHH